MAAILKDKIQAELDKIHKLEEIQLEKLKQEEEKREKERKVREEKEQQELKKKEEEENMRRIEKKKAEEAERKKLLDEIQALKKAKKSFWRNSLSYNNKVHFIFINHKTKTSISKFINYQY